MKIDHHQFRCVSVSQTKKRLMMRRESDIACHVVVSSLTLVVPHIEVSSVNPSQSDECVFVFLAHSNWRGSYFSLSRTCLKSHS